jgi:hypothetical protein
MYSGVSLSAARRAATASLPDGAVLRWSAVQQTQSAEERDRAYYTDKDPVESGTLVPLRCQAQCTRCELVAWRGVEDLNHLTLRDVHVQGSLPVAPYHRIDTSRWWCPASIGMSTLPLLVVGARRPSIVNLGGIMLDAATSRWTVRRKIASGRKLPCGWGMGATLPAPVADTLERLRTAVQRSNSALATVQVNGSPDACQLAGKIKREVASSVEDKDSQDKMLDVVAALGSELMSAIRRDLGIVDH